MKARPPKDWSQNELERLEAGAKMKASAEEIVKSLGRPTASVRRLARSLGLVLYKKPGGGLFAGELLANEGPRTRVVCEGGYRARVLQKRGAHPLSQRLEHWSAEVEAR